MKSSVTIACLAFAILLSGCATYHITTQSMLDQFAGTHEETKHIYFYPGGFIPALFFSNSVKGNSIRKITVLDKKEKQHTIAINNRTSVRITQNSGKKTTFYFNTLLLKDSTINGSKTHFFNARIRPITFSNIKKIELQK